jgi:translation initiation factor IF-3
LPKSGKQITAKNVRLVDSDGEMIGVVTIEQALQTAEQKGLDLVEISPNASPPVCKLLDYSRYKYDMKKKAQESKKKQKRTALKEMKFKVNIGIGDFNIKVNKIRKFLEAGDKVKVSLWFKGREIVHKDKGREIFAKIIETLSDVAKTEADPKFEGKQIIMVLGKL